MDKNITMLVAFIVVQMLVKATVAKTTKTIYELKFGEITDDTIKYLVVETSNSESVGLRVSPTDGTVESLTYEWMENGSYVTGYSYYEKMYVDEEFDVDTWEGDIKVKIQGPLPPGSNISIFYSAEEHFHSLHANLIYQKYMTSNFTEHGDIQLIIDIWTIGSIAYYNYTTLDGGLNMLTYYSQEAIFGEVIDVKFEIRNDRIQGTVIGAFPGEVYQTCPCNTPSAIVLTNKFEQQPYLNRMVYERGI